ncbi:hypothetical protein HGRIS_006179 [Hohenbuehelia grisea]|uniref:Zn(2)-C6 fungal-type domain-containing protein n=1 Tax=Hohenbuehelia grisea TaxID=104357 RepID=A0ABR3K1U6_9AGAR
MDTDDIAQKAGVLEKEVARLTTELSALRGERDAIRQERDEFRRQCAEHRGTVVSLQQRVLMAENSLDVFRSELNDAKRLLGQKRSSFGLPKTHSVPHPEAHPNRSLPSIINVDQQVSSEPHAPTSDVFSVDALRQSVDRISSPLGGAQDTIDPLPEPAPKPRDPADRPTRRASSSRTKGRHGSLHLYGIAKVKRPKQCERCILENTDKSRMCTGEPGAACPQCRAKKTRCSFSKMTPSENLSR